MTGSYNVVALRPRPAPRPRAADPWQRLTHSLIMAQHRAGTLNPAVVEYMLAGIGLEP